jgi:hypothetical protein
VRTRGGQQTPLFQEENMYRMQGDEEEDDLSGLAGLSEDDEDDLEEDDEEIPDEDESTQDEPVE